MFMKYLCLFSSDSGIRLAYDTEANASDVRIPSADDITSAGFFTFGVAGSNARLAPLYHLMDSKVWSDGNYSKQILF